MAKRRGQDNLRDILILINGSTHPKQKPIVDDQRKVIEFLVQQKDKSATRIQLEEMLGLEFSNKKKGMPKWKNNSDKFYRTLSPLFRTVIQNDREELRYTLSDARFTTWFDSLRRTGKELFG